MPIHELLIREFDREMSNTQKTLERVPADKWDWKPHDKSGLLGWMAGHVATLTGFTTVGIKTHALEIADAYIPRVEEQADLLSTFAKMRQEASEALAGVTDEQLQQTWMQMSRSRTSFSRRDRC
jgi:DinB superfamily